MYYCHALLSRIIGIITPKRPDNDTLAFNKLEVKWIESVHNGEYAVFLCIKYNTR